MLRNPNATPCKCEVDGESGIEQTSRLPSRPLGVAEDADITALFKQCRSFHKFFANEDCQLPIAADIAERSRHVIYSVYRNSNA